MKQLLSIILFALSLCVNAQIKLGDFTMSYFEKFGTEYSTNALEYNGNEIHMAISCITERSDNPAYLIIEGKDLPKFKAAMTECRNKLVEWSKTAIENNVENYTKPFKVSMPSVRVFFNYSKWYLTDEITIKPLFMVDKRGIPGFIIKTGELKAHDNEFITHKGLYMVFINEEEFDGFLNVLNFDAYYEKKNRDKNNDELFK